MNYRETPLSDAQRELLFDRAVIQLPTPLLLSVEVPRFSPTAALLMLHVQQCRAAVIGAIDGLREHQVHQQVLAELLIYYELHERLVTLLEVGPAELAAMVIGFPTEGLEPDLVIRIEKAQDMARSLRAKRAALEFLEDMQ